MAYYSRTKRMIWFPLTIGLYFSISHGIIYFSDQGESPLWVIVGWLTFWFSYGVFFCFALDFFHRLKIRWVSGSWASSLTSTEQTREMILRVPYQLVFEECKDFLRGKERIRIDSEDFENGRIHALVPMTLGRWNRESVDIEMDDLGSRMTKVRINSRPVGRMLIFDYGSNYKRVEGILAHLKKIDPPAESTDRTFNLFT